MKIIQTSLPGVLIIEPRKFDDDRGFFYEIYQSEQYREAGIAFGFVQDNLSGSKRGVMRGLHYQIKHPQGKLIFAILGEVYDVAVDIRRSSPSFGQYFGTLLSAENRKQIWIPPGFAHGFYVLSEWAEVIYKVTDFYSPEWERTLSWNDPQINIEWPILEDVGVLLSEKDNQGKCLDESELFGKVEIQ